MKSETDKTYTILEILCVFLWFLLDGFWLMEWRTATYVFSGFAILAAIGMFFYVKRQRTIVLIACADTSWLILNILWAIGDLSHVKEATQIAKVLFGVGILFCVIAFASSDPGKKMSVLVLRRLRILKYFERS